MRIALGIEYDGTDFLGWQRLSHGPTVQGAVEEALSYVADHPVAVTCAGRTDAGVHARCQVVHFDSDAARTERGWMLGTNSRLPSTVAVRWAARVDADFHARYAALGRRYRYSILNRAARPALDARYVAWERQPLDAEAMQRASAALIGENDFSAFRTIACQARTPFRNVHSIRIARIDDRVVIDIAANAFLHHMVRNIVGSLLPVGRGEQAESWIAELLAGRERRLAGPTASASGLCFVSPVYPSRHGLPAEVCPP
ncbi:MAG: tRNA pseudouridine(38-40) synthase TruA [Dokdonella sp.]|uniref:tRNA pseudouridine(38-40) synthase TruA n=1 Tax=Dokdonella sp. TaxID=2291710 RepID=UPI002CC35213|nr:tRNA pseudouridine(38-40) synthase TruA [Dokdonella sp.]HOX72406.1 tRNA pseudouridine(38-40) synthase TruA [Dokdonella sp.]HPG93120.1 tRNA pseudouridine(38-40) synthase TruA [Dokdonella sp.]HPN79004.1 tRNA pseudouridine(38-40) synthase TruA [Dokdonella sp.]